MLDFSLENRVNGDIQLQRASRGFFSSKVKALARRPASKDEISSLHMNNNLKYANAALGYSTNYFDSKVEGDFSRLVRRIRYKFL